MKMKTKAALLSTSSHCQSDMFCVLSLEDRFITVSGGGAGHVVVRYDQGSDHVHRIRTVSRIYIIRGTTPSLFLLTVGFEHYILMKYTMQSLHIEHTQRNPLLLDIRRVI